MSTFIFWACLAILVYSYAGYPLLVALVARIRPSGGSAGETPLPSVSILLSVFNEEAVIREKIENFLALDYPPELLELVVVSDGSTDATESLVSGHPCGRVRLLSQTVRQGKTAALNRAVSEATGEILVFTDADSMFRPDALRRLAARFSSADVGLVSGRTLYVDPETGKPLAAGLYRAYEEWIKGHESRAFSIVGADGAIYAMRRELFEPLSPDLINDFVHTIQVAARGRRAVSEPDAVCLEPAADCGADELARQTRIMAQSWHVVVSQLPLLLAAGKTGYVWQLLSHKALRWLSLPLMAGLLLANVVLAASGAGYGVFLAAQLAAYAGAWVGYRGAGGAFRVLYFFVLLQVSGILGFVGFVRGRRFVTWNPRAN